MSWKNWPSWLRIGIIGGVVLAASPLIATILGIISFILGGFSSVGPAEGLIFFGLFISFIFFMIGALGGAIIGFIIDKNKSKSKRR